MEVSREWKGTVCRDGNFTFFDILHNFLQEWKTGQKTDLELLRIGNAILLRADEVEEDLA